MAQALKVGVPDPVTADPLARIVRAPFWLGARLRRARAVHPRGLTFRARLDVAGAGPLPAGPVDCTVRLSKSVGTPGALPDVLGLALRVPVDGAPVDVLVSSVAGHHGWRQLLLWPTRSWSGALLSTLLPYASATGARARVLMAVEEADAPSIALDDVARHLPVRLDVRVADSGGALQHGRLVVTGPVVEDVASDPVLHPPPGWRLVPDWVSAVRATAYVGSRAGRRARPESLDRVLPG